MPARKPRSIAERYPLVEYVPDLLEIAKRQLVVVRNDGDYHPCKYSFVYEDGSVSDTVSYHCYGGLQKSHQINKEAAYFCTYRTKGAVRHGAPFSEATRGVALSFLDWLLNESIFAPVFLTKDATEAFEEGIICHTHYPAAFVIQACAYSRYPKELPDIVRWWEKLSQHIDKHAALIFGHLFRSSDNDDERYYVDHRNKITDSVFDPDQMGMQELTRMVNADLRLLRDPSFSEVQGPYEEFTRIFRRTGNKRHSNSIKDGPLLAFNGGVAVTREFRDDFGARQQYTTAYFELANLEQDAKRFFEENYAGKDYA